MRFLILFFLLIPLVSCSSFQQQRAVFRGDVNWTMETVESKFLVEDPQPLSREDEFRIRQLFAEVRAMMRITGLFGGSSIEIADQ